MLELRTDSPSPKTAELLLSRLAIDEDSFYLFEKLLELDCDTFDYFFVLLIKQEISIEDFKLSEIAQKIVERDFNADGFSEKLRDEIKDNVQELLQQAIKVKLDNPQKMELAELNYEQTSDILNFVSMSESFTEDAFVPPQINLVTPDFSRQIITDRDLREIKQDNVSHTFVLKRSQLRNFNRLNGIKK